jgi:hypothetical protein
MRNRHTRSIRRLLLGVLHAVAFSAFADDACSVDKLGVKQGMPRMEVEQRIAEIRGEENTYSVYRGGLQGGSVEYRFGNCVLTVAYAPGMLPPWVIGSDGVAQHLAPIDESVQRIQLVPGAEDPKK